MEIGKMVRRISFAAGVLCAITSTALAEKLPVVTAPENLAAAEQAYLSFVPDKKTEERLAERDLPRFLIIACSDRNYSQAVDLFIEGIKPSDKQNSGSANDMVDLIPCNQQARIIDLAVIFAGFQIPVVQGVNRVLEYGQTLLTLGQCAELFVAFKDQIRSWRAENGKSFFPNAQCPGTQNRWGKYLGQIYWKSEDKTNIIGMLGENVYYKAWYMSVFAGHNNQALLEKSVANAQKQGGNDKVLTLEAPR